MSTKMESILENVEDTENETAGQDAENVATDFNDLFDTQEEVEGKENLFEEQVIPLERCGVETGVCIIKEYNALDVDYTEVHIEQANSESQYQYEGCLVSRREGYNIRFEIYNERKVEFPFYNVNNNIELKKRLLEIVKDAMSEWKPEFEINVRTSL